MVRSIKKQDNTSFLSETQATDSTCMGWSPRIAAQKNDVQIAMLPEESSSFETLQWGSSLEFTIGDSVAFKTPDEFWKVSITAVEAPEASTFILVGLGLLGVIGIKRWKQ